GVYLGTSGSPEVRKLSDVSSRVEYAAGYLLFGQDGGGLYEQLFPENRLELAGQPKRIATGLGFNTGHPMNGAFTVSTAALAFGGSHFIPPTRLSWYDRAGNRLGYLGAVAETGGVVVAPDAKHLLLERFHPNLRTGRLWLMEMPSGIETQLEVPPGARD